MSTSALSAGVLTVTGTHYVSATQAIAAESLLFDDGGPLRHVPAFERGHE